MTRRQERPRKAAQLSIFPAATHMIPWQNPELFNRTVEMFFAKSFPRPDTKDLLTAMMATTPR